MADVRVRFAPSPTGVLHVGSARTALLNWLFAQNAGGQLLLRIDDTDAERSRADFEPAILEDLRWLGISWDDGPVRQSSRLERYAEALKELPVEEVDGAWHFEGRAITRSDGSPLYHLATAVDDVDFGITHVLRGRDHLANTEFQTALIRALGAEPPEYVHAPLLVFSDGAKVSKSAGEGVTVAGLRAAGFPASAVVNALALSLADFEGEEVMTDSAAIAERFSLERLHSADSRFDEDKLRWLSGRHIRELSDEDLRAALMEFGAGEWLERWSYGEIPEAAVEAARTGGETFEECVTTVRHLLDPLPPDAEALEAIHDNEVGMAWALLDEIVTEWPPSIERAREATEELKADIESDGWDVGVCLRGIRAVLTAQVEGPEFPLMLACITKGRWDNAGYEGQ